MPDLKVRRMSKHRTDTKTSSFRGKARAVSRHYTSLHHADVLSAKQERQTHSYRLKTNDQKSQEAYFRHIVMHHLSSLAIPALGMVQLSLQMLS